MSEPSPNKSNLGPYESGFSIAAAMARRPAAAFFYVLAIVALLAGAYLLLGQPGRRYNHDFEMQLTRMQVQGGACVVLSGFFFVCGSIHAVSKRG